MSLNNLFDDMIFICHIIFLVSYYDLYLVTIEQLEETGQLEEGEQDVKTSQWLTMAAFLGIFRGLTVFFRQFKQTRFLTYMVSESLKEMVPFIQFFAG